VIAESFRNEPLLKFRGRLQAEWNTYETVKLSFELEAEPIPKGLFDGHVQEGFLDVKNGILCFQTESILGAAIRLLVLC